MNFDRVALWLYRIYRSQSISISNQFVNSPSWPLAFQFFPIPIIAAVSSILNTQLDKYTEPSPPSINHHWIVNSPVRCAPRFYLKHRKLYSFLFIWCLIKTINRRMLIQKLLNSATINALKSHATLTTSHKPQKLKLAKINEKSHANI